MQETSHWPTHRWNVMSEQRKSDWQHPNSYYRKREETEHAATDVRDTSRHPQPFRPIPTKAVQVMAHPGRDVILEALHFLVEIGNPHHRFIPMVARRSTTAWEILWSRPTEVLDGHCVPFARPKYRRQPLDPPAMGQRHSQFSDCAASLHAPDGKAPLASFVRCRVHRCGPSC